MIYPQQIKLIHKNHNRKYDNNIDEEVFWEGAQCFTHTHSSKCFLFLHFLPFPLQMQVKVGKTTFSSQKSFYFGPFSTSQKKTIIFLFHWLFLDLIYSSFAYIDCFSSSFWWMKDADNNHNYDFDCDNNKTTTTLYCPISYYRWIHSYMKKKIYVDMNEWIRSFIPYHIKHNKINIFFIWKKITISISMLSKKWKRNETKEISICEGDGSQ